MTELESFEKWASDQYDSIARYETLPTKPYKSLEVEAAHNAWMERATACGWVDINDELPILKALDVDNYESMSDYVIGFREDGQVLRVKLYSWVFTNLNDRKSEWFSDIDDDYKAENITHWMELPKLPRENKP